MYYVFSCSYYSFTRDMYVLYVDVMICIKELVIFCIVEEMENEERDKVQQQHRIGRRNFSASNETKEPLRLLPETLMIAEPNFHLSCRRSSQCFHFSPSLKFDLLLLCSGELRIIKIFISEQPRPIDGVKKQEK